MVALCAATLDLARTAQACSAVQEKALQEVRAEPRWKGAEAQLQEAAALRRALPMLEKLWTHEAAAWRRRANALEELAIERLMRLDKG